jgi:hypothetical protein
MGDITYIVDKLNEKPFQYKLTLLSFRYDPRVPYHDRAGCVCASLPRAAAGCHSSQHNMNICLQ